MFFFLYKHKVVYKGPKLWDCSWDVGSDLMDHWIFPWDFDVIWMSLDWFKGNFTGKPHIEWEKSMVSCKFSLKPIH